MYRKIVRVFTLAIVPLIMFNSCRKEDLLQTSINNSSQIKQQKSGMLPVNVFPFNVINLSSFESEYFNAGDSFVFYEPSIITNGIDYEVFITDSYGQMRTWAQQKAEEKSVHVELFDSLYFAVFWGETPMESEIFTFPIDFQYGDIVNGVNVDVEDYVIGADFDIEEEVVDTNEICYGVKITINSVEIEEWKQAEEDLGKRVVVIQASMMVFPGFSITVYIGVSKY